MIVSISPGSKKNEHVSKQPDPLACTSLIKDLITPTSVQFSKGPRKYETPFLRTSASIFCCAKSWIACMNKAGAKDKRVLGFVDLNLRQYTSISGRFKMRYLRIVSSMPSLFWSNKALNHARNDGTSSCGTSCGRAATFFTIPGSTTFCSQVNEHLCNYGGKACVRRAVLWTGIVTCLICCDHPL